MYDGLHKKLNILLGVTLAVLWFGGMAAAWRLCSWWGDFILFPLVLIGIGLFIVVLVLWLFLDGALDEYIKKLEQEDPGRVEPPARKIVFKQGYRLKDSALFMACLEMIRRGTLNNMYVNAHMACFNFRVVNTVGKEIVMDVAERDVMDFQKCGFAPLPDGSAEQYLLRLYSEALSMPYVMEVRIEWMQLPASPFLIYDGYYDCGSAPGACPVLTVQYSNRIRKKKGLRSSRIKP